MTGDGDGPDCGETLCELPASFRLYDPDASGWQPVCERHALELHPSLEIGALLESGYLRPVELGEPEGPPAEPVTGRSRAFREEVEHLLGWQDTNG